VRFIRWLGPERTFRLGYSLSEFANGVRIAALSIVVAYFLFVAAWITVAQNFLSPRAVYTPGVPGCEERYEALETNVAYIADVAVDAIHPEKGVLVKDDDWNARIVTIRSSEFSRKPMENPIVSEVQGSCLMPLTMFSPDKPLGESLPLPSPSTSLVVVLLAIFFLAVLVRFAAGSLCRVSFYGIGAQVEEGDSDDSGEGIAGPVETRLKSIHGWLWSKKRHLIRLTYELGIGIAVAVICKWLL